MVPTLASIAKSAIVKSSPANHSDLSRNESNVLSKILMSSLAADGIFLTPERRTGR